VAEYQRYMNDPDGDKELEFFFDQVLPPAAKEKITAEKEAAKAKKGPAQTKAVPSPDKGKKK